MAISWPTELTVFNATTAGVLATVPLGGYPETAAIDAANGDVFVVCAGGTWGPVVAVLNLTTNIITRLIPVGIGPTNIVDDPVHGFLYVADSGADNVSVINGTSERLVTNIPLGHYPSAMSVDPAHGSLFVLDQNGPINLTVVNTSSESVTARIPLAITWNNSSLGLLAFDDVRSRLYVGLTALRVLTIVSTSNDTILQNVTLPSGPAGVAVDRPVGAVVVSYWDTGLLTFLSAANDSLLGNLSSQDGGGGFSIDRVTGQLDIANAGTDELEVVNASSRWFFANVSVGLHPDGILYDPFSGDLYVSEIDQGGVTVLNGSTLAVVGTVPTGGGASSMELCPTIDRVFVSNAWTSTVSALNATTNSLVATVRVPLYPGVMAWDPYDGDLYVLSGGGNIAVINGTTATVVATLSGFQTPPTRLAFDPSTREVYVMDGYGGPVEVFNGTTHRLVANVSLGNGFAVDIAYEPTTAEVWAVTSYPGMLMAISPGNHTVTTRLNLSAPGIWGMAVEPTSGTIVVTLQGNSYTGVEEFVNASTVTPEGSASVGTSPSSILFFEQKHLGFVSNSEDASLSVLNLTTDHGMGTLGTGANPTNFALDPLRARVYCTNSGSGTLTVLGRPVLFPVRFTEGGLRPMVNWSVSVDQTNYTTANSTLTIAVPNGTHPFSVTPPPGFVASPSAGTVTVNGASVTTRIAFRPAYPVTFSATGLLAGTPWSVSLNGSTGRVTGSSLSFVEPNGTYNYTVANVPGWRSDTYGGVLTIAGTGTTILLNWTRTLYDVSFTSLRLPIGESWAVIVGAHVYRNSTSTIAFRAANGTANYSIAGAPGYAPVRPNGTFTVDSSSVAISVNFTAGSLVEFNETGLPPGTSWEATLGGSVNFSSTPTIGFEIPIGRYGYVLTNVPGWRAGAYSGYVTNLGRGAAVNVSWTQSLYAVAFDVQGLPSATYWSFSIDSQVFNQTASLRLISLPNGTFGFTVANVPGWHSSEYVGTVNVSGRSANVVLTWTPYLFPLTIRASGLPSGEEWSANWNGGTPIYSTSGAIVFQVMNGTGTFTIGAIPGWQANRYKGRVTVDDGPAGAEVVWTMTRFPVSLNEVGLPAGTSWSVTSFGTTNRSNGTAVGFEAANGTFFYNVSDVPGWRASAYAGNLTVDGRAANASIAWVRTTYSLTLSAIGLPPNTSWSADVNGTVTSTSTSTLTILGLWNGTYVLSAWSVGLVARGLPTEVVVHGGPIVLTVQFSPATAGHPETIPLILGSLAAVLAAVGLALVGLVLWRRRRPPPTPRHAG